MYEIEIVQGDICESDTEVIVNAANNHLWMGSGVAGAIKRAGGETIEKEAMTKGPVYPGEAVHTSAGKLKFTYVFHGAVMGQSLRTSDKLIRQTTIACLVLAEKLNIKSMAFPAFGTGVGGFPITACANIMITAAKTFQDQARSLQRVQFCLFDDASFATFKAVLAAK